MCLPLSHILVTWLFWLISWLVCLRPLVKRGKNSKSSKFFRCSKYTDPLHQSRLLKWTGILTSCPSIFKIILISIVWSLLALQALGIDRGFIDVEGPIWRWLCTHVIPLDEFNKLQSRAQEEHEICLLMKPFQSIHKLENIDWAEEYLSGSSIVDITCFRFWEPVCRI